MSEHIRIGDVAPRTQFVADGIQTVFPYPFPIFDAGDLEIRLDALVANGGFSIAGAGDSAGGTVTFAEPPANGVRVTLRRVLPVSRSTDFQENGVLRANTLNDELDYQVAALQEAKEAISTTIRLAPDDLGALEPLPRRDERAGRVLGFDAVGELAVFDRGEPTFTLPFPGGVPRDVEDKMQERLTARDFGAVGDGTTDDGPALAAAMNAAAASGKVLEIGEGTFRSTRPLVLPAAAGGLIMRGVILYDPLPGAPRAALTIGDLTVRVRAKSYTGIRVRRAVQSDWSNDGVIGCVLRNFDACFAEVLQADGFSIGLRTEGSGIPGAAAGFEDTTIVLGRLIDNRIGLDIHASQPGPNAWNNSVRYIGGHFANSSATNPTRGRYGVRLSAAAGAYDLHNAHVFVGPAFELQRQGTPGTVDAIPFLVEVSGRGLIAHGVRMEACSPLVARHTRAFSDAVYEVAYTGTYAFTGNGVDYPATATRAGGSVRPLHQAAAAHFTPRLVAAAENLRQRAFRQTVVSADGVGFEQMAVLSSNPGGPPTTLNGFCFAGLSQITLTSDAVQLPTSRAVAFVVDCGLCKEFFLAVDGDNMRPVFLQFDAAENLLQNAAPLLLSNANANWNPGESGGAGSAFWWEMNANLDSLSGGIPLNRLQRVTFHPSARYGVIGVRGGDSVTPANNLLRSFRLFCAATDVPTLVYGGSRSWGVREYPGSAAWDPPSIAAGASAFVDVPVPGARPGDFVDGSFSLATTLPIDAFLVASNTVRVRVTNNTGGAIDLNPGTAFARATKPRL